MTNDLENPFEVSLLDNYLTTLSFFQLNCVSESFVLTASQLNVTFSPFNAFLDIGLILITGFKVLPSVQIKKYKLLITTINVKLGNTKLTLFYRSNLAKKLKTCTNFKVQ